MDERGQSELVGVVLLIGLTVLGTTAVVAFGAGTIADSRADAELRSTEHAMTLFDSKAANVALGESPVRTVQFGRTDGRFETREGGGTMRIEHHTEGDDEPVEWAGCGTEPGVCEIDLGAMVYTQDGTEIAYQGGGVWRHEGGGTTMVSPPEFHYRGETLTLPVVATRGEGSTSASAGGGPTATLRSDSEDGSAPAYAGAIESGTVSVTVESPYYRGWERYFEERTNGAVSADQEAESATVELVSTETQGEFALTSSDNAVRLRGLSEGEPVDRFEFTLYPYEGDASGFNNLDWRLRDDGSELALAFESQGNADAVDLTVTSPDGTESHTFEDAFAIHGPEERVDVDLMSDDLESDGETLGALMNRYLAETGPSVDFEVHDRGRGTDNRISYERSMGYLEYDGSGQFIAYLHVTENELTVRLN